MAASSRTGFVTSKLFVLLASLAFALAPPAARAQTVRVNGALVLPVEDGPAFDAGEADSLALKGNLSPGGQLLRSFQRAVQSGNLPQGPGLPAASVAPAAAGGGGDLVNRQVNDPALDHIQTFDPAVVVTRPFEFSTQSETSLVARGRHVVVGYNTSAGGVVEFFPGSGLAFTQLLFSGFSTSHDGGRTWKSGFVPPASPDAPFTFGDPALAMDRHGNVFYASLGVDAAGASGLIINRSSDFGDTWTAATPVVLDDGADKEWLAIGPDPRAGFRDNLYVTWTSFKSDANGNTTGSELWLARSIDAGATWTTRQLFAPQDDGVVSSFIQFSNPVVDQSSGRLYIPFLHFSDADADFVRVLVSDDGGLTFRFLAFNVPGAVDAFAFPNVTPGLLNDCRGGGIRNALVQGADTGLGRQIKDANGNVIFQFPEFSHATRLVSQPHAAAANGRFAFVVNSNRSPFFGDSSQGSDIRAAFSRDGGATWATATIAATSAADPQHVHPNLSMTDNGAAGHVAYYVQQANGQLRVDAASLRFGPGIRVASTQRLSTTSFDLTPSNVPRTPTATTNYDRAIVSCYDIGEYLSVRGDGDGNTLAAWGDNRNTWTSPPGSPAAGTHQQPDVFFGLIGN
ncbi:MAG TPA: sialidase family protein [Anaeromyxobacter sp.]|nr:sialidase family protein [Anaeromyxobacter sp.]